MIRPSENYHQKPWEINSIWNVLSAEQKMFLDSEVEIVSYKKNAVFHVEGDLPTHVMMLVHGKVRIYKEGLGQKQIIRMLKPGDLFGYRAVIAGDQYNSCASAVEDCLIYKINSNAFNQIAQSNNAFCFAMMQEMARDLAISEIRTISLTQKHIRGRLAETLLNLRKQYGLEEDGMTIAMYLSREDMANLSNMTTANAIRTLSQFANEGMIALDGKRIKVLQEETLTKISTMG